jgi:hypothetical protein
MTCPQSVVLRIVLAACNIAIWVQNVTGRNVFARVSQIFSSLDFTISEKRITVPPSPDTLGGGELR